MVTESKAPQDPKEIAREIERAYVESERLYPQGIRWKKIWSDVAAAIERERSATQEREKILVEALKVYADERNFIEGNDWVWVGDDDPKTLARAALASLKESVK